jgi:hypothetical protein
MVWLTASLICQAWAAAPQADHLFPAGGQRGTVLNVSVAGTFDAWPVRTWTDDPGLVFEARENPGQFRASLGRAVRLGPHLVRFYHAEGCSAPCLFVAGDSPELVEWGSAERQGAGAPVTSLPMTLNGQLGTPGEADAYLLALESGQLLQADLLATRLDSPLRPRLRLVAPDGQTVGATTNHPPEDPFLEVRTRTTGTHRLLVEANPTSPASGGQGTYRIELRGLTAPKPTFVPGAVLYQSPEIPGNPASVIVRANAEWSTPQHPDTLPPTLELPGSFTGFINPIGDEDRFSFLGRRDEIHHFLLQAGSLGSPLAPVLRVMDGSQRILAEASSGPDVSLDWLVPWDGAYILAVGDASGGGGPDFSYALEIRAPEPHFDAEVSGHTWRLPPGADATVSVKLRRPATHRRMLTVTATGLPAGVTASTGLITPDGAGADVRIRVEPGAAPANAPFQVTLLDASAVPLRILTGQARLQGRHAPPDGLILNRTETLWLTVVSGGR